MRNSKGIPTSTVFGFTLALEEILRKENPSHLAVVFDPPGPTFRHELYPPYKENREATPEDIKEAVPYIKRLISALDIALVEEAGFEADDVIGTLAKSAEKEGFTVYMMTPDKDYAQLVSEKVMMYKPGRGGSAAEVWGPEEVCEKFLVEHPEQVIDILALWGDSSDNIPGAPGVGEKTAKKLIGQFQSVEGVYDHIHEIKGKQKEKLEQSRAQVLLSKKLATIVLDVPLQVTAQDFIRKAPHVGDLEKLLQELEFKNIGTRLLAAAENRKRAPQGAGKAVPGQAGDLFAQSDGGRPAVERAYQNLESLDHSYRLIDNLKALRSLAKELKGLKSFCFDTETTGLDPMEAELVGLAFSWNKREAVYVAFEEDEAEIQAWLEELRAVFADEGIEKIGQNLKYDLHILKNYDIEVRGLLFDTMLAHFILKPEQKHNLNVLAEQYLDYSMVKIEDLIGKKGSMQRSFRTVSPEKACEYAGEDADITWQLADIFKKEIKDQGFDRLAGEIEMPLIPVLMHMEHQGVKLDVAALDSFAGDLRDDILKIETEIWDLAGMEFNIASPKQLGEILFEHLQIVKDAKRTKTKQYATGEEVLLQLQSKHPIISKILEYRSLRKLLNTYVEALPRLVKERTGHIHTSFNQALVSTGRLSSVNPNLQNIPIREERGREIRRAFIPASPDRYFFSADYSQIELRLMAHLSGDEHMIQAFVNQEDIHTATAAKIYRIRKGEVSREMRNAAKTANFGIIYGISAFGLAQRMQISRSEAKELIEGYFSSYPGVRAYMDQSIQKAREQGYVETMFGRRRYLPDILSRNSVVRGNAERNAINTPIQGSAADVIKLAMIRIQEAFRAEHIHSSMVLQVHDELNFDVLAGERAQVEKIVCREMEQVLTLKVPLTVESGWGANWLEAH